MSTDSQPSSVNATSEPVHVTSTEDLTSLLEANDVVLVDFFATWCGPCQMMEPILDEVAEETDAVIAKVDVDEHQRLAGSFGVTGVPTLVLFAQGEVVETHVGASSAEQLRSLIQEYV